MSTVKPLNSFAVGVKPVLHYLHVFDPGETTGYCMAMCNSTVPRPGDFRVDQTAELKSLMDYRNWYHDMQSYRLLSIPVQHWVVIEQFKMFPGAAQHLIFNKMPAAVRYGTIEILASMLGLELQNQPSSVMSMFNNKLTLERSGLAVLPDGEHQKDAIKHALYFYYNHKELLS